METLFLDIVNGISDSRFWLGPLVFFCVFVILILEIFEIVQGEGDLK